VIALVFLAALIIGGAIGFAVAMAMNVA
jgi:hypothetical protein